MSRLKGADLGITNPSLSSLGAAKNTVGAGLPAITGRNVGDSHYDTAAKIEYTLTGAAGTPITETFAKTAGSSLVGQNTTTGSKTWIAVNAGAGPNSSVGINADGTAGPAGTGGTYYAAGYAGMPTTGRFISVDVLTTAAALAAPSAQDTCIIDIGDASSNAQTSGPIEVNIKPSNQTLTVIVDGTAVFSNSTFASLGIATGQIKHTVVVELRNDKTYAVMVDGITVASGTYTRAIGPVDAFWTTAGTAVAAVEVDNWVDTPQSTLTWTATTPGSPLNYRGQWSASPSPAYAANDLVLRNGIPYNALVVPGSTDPVGAVISLAAQTATGGWLGQKTATPFTVSSAISVSQVKYKIGTGGAATTGGLNVGIATSVGASPAYVALGTSHAGVAAGGTDTVVFATPATLVPGTTYYFICDETVIGSSTTTTLTGVLVTVGFYTFGTNYATTQSTLYVPFELDGNPWSALTSPTETVNTVAASGTTQTLPDVSTATMHNVTLTANTTITLPAPGAGKSFTVRLAQDATGGRTVAWATPSGAIRWPGGTAPTITATANAVDVVTFICVDGANYLGFVAGQAFA